MKVLKYILLNFKKAREIDDIKIVRIQQELHATNSAVFKKTIYELTGIKPQFYIMLKKKLEEAQKQSRRKADDNEPSRIDGVSIFSFSKCRWYYFRF